MVNTFFNSSDDIKVKRLINLKTCESNPLNYFQVIEQLFSRLDVDGDGRISFEEFLQMFQTGGQAGNNALSLDDSLQLVCKTDSLIF